MAFLELFEKVFGDTISLVFVYGSHISPLKANDHQGTCQRAADFCLAGDPATKWGGDLQGSLV